MSDVISPLSEETETAAREFNEAQAKKQAELQNTTILETSSDEGPSIPEPKNTRARNWLAGSIKAARRLPYEKMGRKELSGAVANRLGGTEHSIGKSSLEFRELQMGVDFIREIKRIQEKKETKKKNQGPVRILDVGSGQSSFLSQLKKRFGKQLEAHSVDIRFFSPEKYPEKRGVEQHVFHVEGLTKKLPVDYFDMIVDTRGGMLYASDREKALDEVYTVLAPGGSAYIFPKPRGKLSQFFAKDWIQNWSAENQAKTEYVAKDPRLPGKTLKVTKPEIESRAQ